MTNINIENNRMKKMLLSAMLSVLFFACDKENETKETPCPTVAAKQVPQAVLDAFAHRYAPDLVITWFQKDPVGYCAYFKQGGTTKKLAEFDGTGMFLREETEHDGDHQDKDSSTTATGHGTTTPGCECDLPE